MSDNGNGNDSEYQALLEELSLSDNIVNAEDVAAQPPWLPIDQQHRSNASLLASIPGIEHYYDKKEKVKGLLLDLENRCIFKTYEQFILFNEWADWCEEFGQSYDALLRYLAGVVSVEGKSRDQYTDAITTMRLKRYANYGNNNKPQRQPGESRLS